MQIRAVLASPALAAAPAGHASAQGPNLNTAGLPQTTDDTKFIRNLTAHLKPEDLVAG